MKNFSLGRRAERAAQDMNSSGGRRWVEEACRHCKASGASFWRANADHPQGGEFAECPTCEEQGRYWSTGVIGGTPMTDRQMMVLYTTAQAKR
ncbi:MAG: hypothetical protein ABI629_09920 [bacterium]